MSWRLDRDGAALWEPLSDDDIACRDEEIAWHDLNNRPWKLVNGLIEQSGDPTALAGGFAGLEVTPVPGVYPTTTPNSATIDVAMWNTASYTPIQANPQCPKVFLVCAFGTCTTAAAPGTVSFQPRFGQLQTSPSIGLSLAAAQTASQTATPWKMFGKVVILKGGIATAGQVVATFEYTQGTAVSGGSASLPALDQMFGTTTGAVSVVTDGSVAAGLWMGMLNATVFTNTYIPQSVIWCSWN